jgi:hypothetical protein
MNKKPHYRVTRLWQQLRNLVSEISEEQTYELLNTVKLWVEENQRILGSNFAKDRPALSLLLEGKASQFPNSQPLAGRQMRYLILALPPTSIEDTADTLETAIREFAVFTKWEDCPICQEGFLGYWIEPHTKTWVLCCPECWWQQDLSGKKWLDASPLLPASIEELSMQSIQLDENSPHIPE